MPSSEEVYAESGGDSQKTSTPKPSEKRKEATEKKKECEAMKKRE